MMPEHSGETNHLDKRAPEENAPDLTSPDPFKTEDALSTIPSLDTKYKRNDQTEKEINLMLTGRNDVYAPYPKQPLYRRGILLRALPFLVVIALLAYAFWSLTMGRSGTSLNTTNKKGLPIPNTSATSIPIPLIPAQRTQASATNIPTAHPSVSVISTPTTIATPSTTPTPTPTPIPRISYEAESSENTLTGSAQIYGCAGCSGGKRVAFLGKQTNGANGTLQFNNVNKSIAGSYTMTIYYTEGNTGGRTGYISVNTGPAIAFIGAYTGDWNNVETVNMTISLSAGNNTIEFFNLQQGAPDIDRIVV